jgi:integrase
MNMEERQMSNLALAIDNTKETHDHVPDQRFKNLYNEFLDGQLTASTKANYRTDIEYFCKQLFKVKPEYVTLKQILGLTVIDSLAYHNHLKTLKENGEIKNATIHRRIKSVRMFLKLLHAYDQEVNANIFDVVKLEKVTLDQNTYGNIEWDEAKLFIEYASIEEMEGQQMAMLIKLACVSSLRLEALLSLSWEDSFKVKNEKGRMVNYIDAISKGTRHNIPISDILFNELHEKLGVTGKLFSNLHAHKVGKLLKEIIVFFEISADRNIKFHSFKKSGINRVLDRTGDLTKAQIQGMHKSIVTTNNSYIARKDDLTKRPSYTLDQEIDVTGELKDASREELLSAIAQMSESAQFELLRIIKKG